VIAAWLACAVALSFVLSATETAIFAIDRAERERLSHDRGGQRFVSRLERLEGRAGLETTLVTANLAATVATVALAVELASAWTPWWPAVVVFGLVPILVLVPEVTAKAIGYRFAVPWARMMILPVMVLHGLFTPIRWSVAALQALVARVVPPDPEDTGREAEIRHLIEQGAEEGTVAERERDIVEAVFEFGELTIGRLMTPRPDMHAVPYDLPWDELIQRCRENGYSRVPVYQRRVDEILGVLLLKDLLRHRAVAGDGARGLGPHQLRSLLIPPLFVPQTKPASDMLREFLARKQHMAFVVDEHGTLVGLITLDDLLRELVGEFLDHEDHEEQALAATRPGQWTVKAWMDVDDFVEETGVAVPKDGYHTVGGFVFHMLGRLPHKGDAVETDGHRFVVAAMEGRRIAEVTVTKIEAVPATPSSEGSASEAAG
jgi:putative hemolysin